MPAARPQSPIRGAGDRRRAKLAAMINPGGTPPPSSASYSAPAFTPPPAPAAVRVLTHTPRPSLPHPQHTRSAARALPMVRSSEPHRGMMR